MTPRPPAERALSCESVQLLHPISAPLTAAVQFRSIQEHYALFPVLELPFTTILKYGSARYPGTPVRVRAQERLPTRYGPITNRFAQLISPENCTRGCPKQKENTFQARAGPSPAYLPN